jgi:uncharacterized protein (TIGR02217 family)
MALISTRLSTRAEAGFVQSPAFKTNVRQLRSGNETRNAEWATPLRRYTASYAAFETAERAELVGCQMACRGQLHDFLFRDWLDFRVTGQSLGVAPSGTTAVQLVRTYTFGSETLTRTVKRPVSGSVTVYQAGVAKAGTVDTATGLFTPSTAWSAGQALTADFDFDVRVRFANDFVEFTLPHRDVAQVQVELIEVRE